LIYTSGAEKAEETQLECTVVKPKGWNSWEQTPFLSLLVSEFVMNQGLSSDTSPTSYSSRIRLTRYVPPDPRGSKQPLVMHGVLAYDPLWRLVSEYDPQPTAHSLEGSLSSPGLASIFDLQALLREQVNIGDPRVQEGRVDLSEIAISTGSGYWEFIMQQHALVWVDDLEKPTSFTVCRYDSPLQQMDAMRQVIMVPNDRPGPDPVRPVLPNIRWQDSLHRVARQLTSIYIEHAFTS
jgi:hypothetical protein